VAKSRPSVQKRRKEANKLEKSQIKAARKAARQAAREERIANGEDADVIAAYEVDTSLDRMVVEPPSEERY
jgi:ribosomal protein S20